MKFYEIDIEYIKYLHSFDKEVYYDASNNKYTDKPYVGIIVYKDNIKYFIPLTSAKKKHLKLKNNGRDYLLIYEIVDKNELREKDIYKQTKDGKYKKILSLVDFRKAVPVPEGYYNQIDIRKSVNRDLLAKEYAFCKVKEEVIYRKCKGIIKYQKEKGDVFFAYCHFNLLEAKMKNFIALNKEIFCERLIRKISDITDQKVIDLLVQKIVSTEYSIGGGGNSEYTFEEVTKQIIKMYKDHVFDVK